ncbi:energy transducer TonB [Aliiglaciecola sp. M165]|nr:energy transducer TonB [Aliiglaciecola sp. M165]
MIFLSISGCKSTSLAPKPEGWVELAFDIDKSGNPINISVVDSHPSGVFDDEGIKALSKWKYKPELVDGNPVVQKDRRVKLDFILDNES